MADIDPLMGLDRPTLFNEGLPSSALLYNALRQAGIAFDPGNPRIARLLRMAPALAQAFQIQQAQNPSLGWESAMNSDDAIRDFYMKAVTGQGARQAISSAMQGFNPLVQQARQMMVDLGGNLEGVGNTWLRQFAAQASDFEDVEKMRETFLAPFMTPQGLQAYQRGSALLNLPLYNRAAAEGLNPLDYQLGRITPAAPLDEAILNPPSAAPAVPQGLEVTPYNGADLGFTPEDQQTFEEAFGTSEEEKRRKAQRAKQGAQPYAY